MRIIEIVATRCQILRLKCTKFDFSWGSALTLLGEFTALPQIPIAAFQGPTSRRREGAKGKGRGGKGMGGSPGSSDFSPGCRGARIVSVQDDSG